MIRTDAKVHISAEVPRRLILQGELDYQDAPRIREGSDALLEAGITPLRIDARDLHFLDSSGLSALIHAARGAAHRHTHVCIIGANSQLLRLLRVTNLLELFHLEDPAAEDPCEPEAPENLPPGDLSIDLPCHPSALAVARDRVGELLQGRGFDRRQRDDIYLALGEAIANAIRHGCPLAPVGSRIRLNALCNADALVLEVTDQGPGFDPDTIPEPDATELKDGGMGLFFMRSVMDSLEYHKDDQGNTARMVKRMR